MKGLLAVKLGGFLAASYAVGQGLNMGFALSSEQLERVNKWIAQKTTRVQVVERVVTVKEQKKNLGRLILEVAEKHRVPAVLMAGLITQESGAELRPDRIRYEQHLQKRFRCKPYETEAECRMYASSIGYGQIIYGIWRETCGLKSWSSLLDENVNLNCSAKILSECLERKKALSNGKRLRACLSEYNGDGTGRYAQDVVNHTFDILVDKEMKEHGTN